MAKPRDLSNLCYEGAEANFWQVDKGSGDEWEVVAKSHNDRFGMMKSTKRMRLENGYLYQVTTEGPLGYAEALTYVPDKAKPKV